MCGIVGYISKDDKSFPYAKEHFMRFALALDTLRGHDSTGVMTLTKRFATSVIKTTMPGDKFVHSDRYIKKVKPGWAQVGHNRAATKGSVKIDNAHPFQIGDISLVHNGTLYKAGENLESFDESLEVDSMQIANALSAKGPEEASDVLTSLDGSFALVWFDKRDESVNMARNLDRPLHFGYNTAQTIMWFMSDGSHLHAINKSFQRSDCAATTVYQLDRHKHIKWRKGDLVPEVTTFAPFTRAVVPATPIYTGTGTHSHQKYLPPPANPGHKPLKDRIQILRRSGGGTTKKLTSTTGYIRGNVSTNVPDRTILNNSARKVPAIHKKCLEDEFGFGKNEEFLEFIPKKLYDLGHHKMYVTGVVNLPTWGDVEYDAVIHNATEVQAKAYQAQSWLVRSIGVGLPTDNFNAPSILCHLVHCSWATYVKENPPKPKQEAADSGKVPMPHDQVMGPGGKYAERRVLQPKLDTGCIQCGGGLPDHEIEEAIYVNEGRDIMCGGCQKDFLKETVALTTGMHSKSEIIH